MIDEKATFGHETWLIALAAAIVLVLFVGTAGLWPWDHDEVQTLMEVGAVPMGTFPGPAAQMERMHRLVPVWWLTEAAALRVLPVNEFGSRALPSLAGAATVILAFIAGLRARGLWFACALLVLVGGSQITIWLAQQARFYPIALLEVTIALLCIWSPDGRAWRDLGAVLAAAGAVLTHNLTMIVFVLVAGSVTLAWFLDWVPLRVLRRAALCAIVTLAIFGGYLRPLLVGWQTGGTGGTSPLVSFAAQVGFTPLALAAFGSVAAFTRPSDSSFRVWVLVLLASIGFVACGEWLLGNWNPRYDLFFVIPVWVLAAAGADTIATSLPSPRLAAASIGVIALLQLPKFASHFIDGSRHDFRSAARIVAAQGPAGQVLSNWPATLQYYLQPATGQRAAYWFPGESIPDPETVIVLASNAWEPILTVPGRQVTTLGEIGHRRFDEQSYLIRIYRVARR